MSPPNFSERTIHLASNFATLNYDKTMTRCLFQLSKPIVIPEEYSLEISVLSASIPYTYYGIPNPITVNIQRAINGVFEDNNVIIPSGNWSVYDIATMLTIPGIITVSFVPQKGLFLFQNADATSRTVEIYGAVPMLGLSEAITTTTVQGVYAPNIPNVSGTRYVLVQSSLKTDTISAGTIPQYSGVLCAVPVNARPNELIVYQPNHPVRNIMKESSISSIEITMTDSDGQPLSFLGSPWELDLLVSIEIPPGETQSYNEDPRGGNIFGIHKGYRRG